VAKGAIRKGRRSAKDALETVADAAPEPSPNPMTNLIIADLALRGGGQLLRHAVERTLLGARYSKAEAKNLVKGRTMKQTLIGTAIARLATRSVPGAIVVGGGLLAKTLYDRRKGKAAARAEGRAAIAKQADKGALEG
jgi:hypothetical protein